MPSAGGSRGVPWPLRAAGPTPCPARRAGPVPALRGERVVVTGVTGQVAEPLAVALAGTTRSTPPPGSPTRRPGSASRRPASPAWRWTWPPATWAALPAHADRGPPLRRLQDQRLGRRPRRQRGRPGLADGAPPPGPGLPALLVGRRLPPGGPPALRTRTPRSATTTASGPSSGPTASPRSPPRPRPGGAPGATRCRPPSPGSRSPTATGADGPPSISRCCSTARRSRSTSTPRASTTRSTRTTSWPTVPGLLAAASVPATVVNWGGDRGGQHRGVVRLSGRAHRAWP